MSIPRSGLDLRAQPLNTTILADATGNSPSQSPSSTVAMIVLYAVTGCVSLLFCLIIISGAIRAIRHPERYGPRARFNDGENGWSQTRAQGLTRAILDTFPIVKFGSSREAQMSDTKDIEGRGDLEAKLPEMSTGIIQSTSSQPARLNSEPTSSINPEPATGPHSMVSSSGENETESVSPSLNDAQPASSNDDAIPAGIGRETCPICIVDFEEGDDLRVLPCDGAHRFHQSCVDPWLLELSTACPICRQDFTALENIISGGSETQGLDSPHRISRLRRFSRYLRFARHGHDQNLSET